MNFSASASLLSAFVYSLLIAFRSEIVLWDGVFAFFLAAVSFRISVRPLLRLLRLNIAIVFISATILLFHNDIHYALLIFLRANLILTANVLLFYHHGAMGIYHGFAGLKLPDRFTVLLFFVVKYIEILGLEYRKLRESLKVRSFRPKTSIFTYKTIGFLVGMLFVKSMERSKALHHAMILRGFQGKLYHFNYRVFLPSDILLFSALIIQTFFTLRVVL